MSSGADGGVDAPEAGEQPTWSRWVIIGGTLLAVLLIGATAGMFVTRLSSDDPAATPAAGSVEVGFAQDMAVHHLQAVTMAGMARDRSTDPEIRTLAFDIERTQLEQVGRMKGWLMLWDQPEQATGAYMTWMTEPNSGMAGMSMPAATSAAAGGPPMPGMATTAEMTKLRSLPAGKDFDVYFLQLMLRHHQGGTAMTQYAQAHSSLPALQALARSILVSQGAEMDQIKLMLSARGARPLPA
ncbi:DUF305 domain-containing protein [Streptomyces sp. MN03-5084-2B]|nr:DUF305 domain-containing protein [Streptomyces sp. MN03-5084-2B]